MCFTRINHAEDAEVLCTLQLAERKRPGMVTVRLASKPSSPSTSSPLPLSTIVLSVFFPF
jgi:hypothetical protein